MGAGAEAGGAKKRRKVKRGKDEVVAGLETEASSSMSILEGLFSGAHDPTKGDARDIDEIAETRRSAEAEGEGEGEGEGADGGGGGDEDGGSAQPKGKGMVKKSKGVPKKRRAVGGDVAGGAAGGAAGGGKKRAVGR